MLKNLNRAAPTQDEIDELQRTFDQSLTWLETVGSKHDFSPEGNREFATALQTATIARQNLWQAEYAATRSRKCTPSANS